MLYGCGIALSSAGGSLPPRIFRPWYTFPNVETEGHRTLKMTL